MSDRVSVDNTKDVLLLSLSVTRLQGCCLLDNVTIRHFDIHQVFLLYGRTSLAAESVGTVVFGANSLLKVREALC